jgi:hypothetical protein
LQAARLLFPLLVLSRKHCGSTTTKKSYQHNIDNFCKYMKIKILKIVSEVD